MIVTCPSCEAKYRVNADALSARGGRVKCASCGHGWVVEDEGLTLMEPVDAAPQPAPEPDPEPAPSITEKPHAAVRARAEQRRRKARLMTEGAGWAGVAACVAIALVSAAVFRVDIVNTWPRAAGAYAAVGLNVNPYGLEVGELNAAFGEEAGVPALIVEGLLQNITGREKPALPLKARLFDAEGGVLTEWPVTVESPALAAHASERFRTLLPNPPEGAARVEVVIAGQASQPDPEAQGESHEAAAHAADHGAAPR